VLKFRRRAHHAAWVAFSKKGGERLVGQRPKRQAVKNPQTQFFRQAFHGRNSTCRANCIACPTRCEGGDATPISITVNGETKTYSPAGNQRDDPRKLKG